MSKELRIDAALSRLGTIAITVASGAALVAFVAMLFAAAGFAYGIAEAVISRAVSLGLDLARLVL